MLKQILAALLGVPLLLATLCGAHSLSFNFYVEYWAMPLEKYGVRSPLRWQDIVFIAVVWSVLLSLFYISYRLLRYAFPHIRKFSGRYRAVAVCLAIVFAIWLNFLAPAGLPLPFARGPVSGNHKFVLFNPFRDRGSELAAQRFFDIIKSGTCGDFNSLAQDVTLPDNLTCEELHKLFLTRNTKVFSIKDCATALMRAARPGSGFQTTDMAGIKSSSKNVENSGKS